MKLTSVECVQFEPKPTRLLLMSLTDGMSDFQAMEYQPIPQLNTELTPGAKVSQTESFYLRGGREGGRVECFPGNVLP